MLNEAGLSSVSPCYSSLSGFLSAAEVTTVTLLSVRVFVSCPLCSSGGGGEVEGHALVSAGPEGPERRQPELAADAHRG